MTRRNLQNVLTTSDGVIEFRKLKDVVDITVDDAKRYLNEFHALSETTDGRVSLETFHSMFKEDLDDEVVARIFYLLDADGTGYLDYRQYVVGAALFAAKSPEAIEQALKLGFRAFDVNNSGFLEIDEARTIIATMHPQDAAQDSEHVERVFQEMDRDGDGKVSEDEFLAYARTFEEALPEISRRLFV